MSSKIQVILKRLIDILLSFIGLVLLAVPFAIVALVIKLDSKDSVFFRQERVGKDGQSFKVWKFRTMVVGAEKDPLGAFTSKGDLRITRVGYLLRRFGIDELPQLINVLKGEMSLVGPRPTLPYQVAKYNDVQRKRLLVKPGITGWALIKGRNSLTWPEKIELDVWYVEHWSLKRDCFILFRTPVVVLGGQGLFLEKDDVILKK